MSVTLRTLRQQLAEDLGGFWSGSATDGTQSSLIDTSHDSPFAGEEDAKSFSGRYLLFTSGINDGRVRRIRNYDPFTFKVIWLNPTDFTTVAAGDTYQMFNWHPASLTRWLNRGLTRLPYQTRTPLTLVTDGDMEATDTSAWTASDATLSKVTDRVQFGTRALRVQNTLAGGYAKSEALRVQPGDEYQVAIGVSVASGTARLVVWDETNGTVITTLTSTTAPFRLNWDRFTIPAGCDALTLRLSGIEATADVYWDTVALLRTNDRRLPGPSWLARGGQIEAIEEVGLAGAGDLYTPDESYFRQVTPWTVYVDPTAAGPLIEYSGSLGTSLLFARGRRAFPELVNDTDTTPAEPRWVRAAARREAAKELAVTTAAEDSRRWEREEVRAATELTYWTSRQVPQIKRAIAAGFRAKGW